MTKHIGKITMFSTSLASGFQLLINPPSPTPKKSQISFPKIFCCFFSSLPMGDSPAKAMNSKDRVDQRKHLPTPPQTYFTAFCINCVQPLRWLVPGPPKCISQLLAYIAICNHL